VSHVLDAKPESCVKIGDLKSEIALDKNRSDEDRATAARQAKNAYHRALQLDPKHLSAYLGLARLSVWLGEYDEAKKTYDTALAKFPKEAIVWYEHGMCLARQKKLDEALPNLQKAAKLWPDSERPTRRSPGS
jgi:Tfp pilus assembly protein PilF